MADVCQCKEEPMTVICNMFNVSMPPPVQQKRSSKNEFQRVLWIKTLKDKYVLQGT